MVNSEVSFKNTLSILNEERTKALSLDGTNMLKMMHLIDQLNAKVISVMEESVENVALIGSKIEIEIITDGVSSYESFILGTDFTDDKVSIFRPLGKNLLGHHVGDNIYFEIREAKNEVRILSINNTLEKQKLLTNN